MVESLIYYSDVKEGHLQENVRQKLSVDLRRFNGKRVEVRVQKLKSTRSQQQNRYYWLLINILSKELGYTPDECHDLIKYKFLKRNIVIGDMEEVLVQSTTKLNKTDFGDFVSRMQEWAAGLGINLPDAGSQVDLNF